MARKPTKRTTAKLVQSTENQPFTLPNIEHKPEIDDAPYEPGSDLTVREKKFVLAYVGPAGGCATKAAEMAGYNANNRDTLATTAWRVLRKAKVQAELGLAFAACHSTPEWTTNRLRELAGSTIANVVKTGEDGELQFDSQTAVENGALGQIKEIKEEIIKVGEGPAKVIKRTVKMHDPTQSLTSLAKMQGILVDRTDITSGGKPLAVKVLRDVTMDDV
jgi:hypothetical protein